MTGFVLAIDQGTTSTRAIVFDEDQRIRGVGQQEFPQHFPRPGWVEHDPEEIWASVVATVRQAIIRAGLGAGDIAAIGITNQRETAVVWDRASGRSIHNAIVWQDRRTAPLCERLKADGYEPAVSEKTGLIIDPYFSGTKVAWLLDNVEGARERAVRGELCFGTIDSFLIWRLTGGRAHATDATNASRTMLYDIVRGEWDRDLCDLLSIPSAMLPQVHDSNHRFGETEKGLFGRSLPIAGVAGDQQAATVGQAAFRPGMIKSTYGTGCFALINTGSHFVRSENRLLSTIAYQIDGVATYALEGSIFVAGAAVQWLRDQLRLIDTVDQSGDLAAAADPEHEIYFVPAFVGLGAPHWDSEARGAIFGLTRGTGPAELARATLESVCFQTLDLVDAMRQDWSGEDAGVLRADGGMVASDWTMQALADILDMRVDRPEILETTALGAAWLAGHKAGVWPDQDGFAANWRLDRRFEPTMDPAKRQARLAGWREAVSRTLTRTPTDR